MARPAIEVREDIKKSASNAKDFIAAEFSFAQKMAKIEQTISELITAHQLKKAVDLRRPLLQVFKLSARSERRVDRDEEKVKEYLTEIKNKFGEIQRKQVEKFLQELEIASGHLQALASFYRGSLRDEIDALEEDEQEELKEEDLLKKLPNDRGLQAKIVLTNRKLIADLSKLQASTAELNKWIESNAALLKQVIAWAKYPD